MGWTPDSAQLVTVSDCGGVRTWEVATGEAIAIQQADVIAVLDSSNLNVAALSPDGRALATGTEAGSIRVIDPATGELRREFSPEGGAGVRSLAWSPDGAYLAGGSYQQIQVWDFQSGERRLVLEVMEVSPEILAWSPDGSRLAAAWYTAPHGYFRIWEVGSALAAGASTASLVGQASEHEGIFSLAWSPDGAFLAVGSYNGIQSPTSWLRVSIFNRNGGRVRGLEVGSYWGSANSLAWSPDGTLLAAGGSSGGLVVWNTITWTLAPAFYFAHNAYWDGTSGLAWSPDGRLLASIGSDGVVRIWGAP